MMINTKNINLLSVFAILIVVLSSVFVIAPSVQAAPACGTPDNCDRQASSCLSGGGSWDSTAGTCSNPSNSGGANSATGNSNFSSGVSDQDGQELVNWINRAITTLTALTAIAIAGSLIFAGIQYSTAGGNPQAAANAKKRISNAIIALLASIFMGAFLQWIVPGGPF